MTVISKGSLGPLNFAKRFDMEVLDDKLELVERSLEAAMDYTAYRDLVGELAQGGRASGTVQLGPQIEYTKINDRRMARWDKTFEVPELERLKLEDLKGDLFLVVLTESWCGDAAASLPIMAKVAEATQSLGLKVLLRDDNPELMDAFLTGGSRSIPKLILLDRKNNEILGEWGPRPQIATQMMEACKREHGTITEAFKGELQLWYNKDKGRGILGELMELLGLE